jgi:hypothetical protein
VSLTILYRHPRRPDEAGMTVVGDQAKAVAMKDQLEHRGYLVIQDRDRDLRQGRLYALWYNFVRIHNTLRMTAEIVVGIETHLLAMEDVVAMTDRRTAARTGTLLGS